MYSGPLQICSFMYRCALLSYTSFCFLDADSSLSLITSYSHFPSPSPSRPLQRFLALSTINQSLLTTKTSPIVANHSRCHSVDIEEPVDRLRSSPNVSYCAQTLSRASSCKSLPTDYKSWVPDEASSSGTFNDYVSCESQVIYRRCRLENNVRVRYGRINY